MAAFDPARRYLLMKIRPMTTADYVPGHSYRPDLIMLEIEAPAAPGGTGTYLTIPVWVPAEYRKSTPENTRLVYEHVYANDPEAREMIDHAKSFLRPWREVEAARALPKRVVAGFTTKPSEPNPDPNALQPDAQDLAPGRNVN